MRQEESKEYEAGREQGVWGRKRARSMGQEESKEYEAGREQGV